VLKRLGKYEIIAELGRGAMGEVFKARDPLIGRLVALKTISDALVGKPDLLARFYQEARSAGTLQHPNVVTVYELGKEGDTPYIAMEYLEGESLEKVIDCRPVLPLSQKLGYIVPVCRALEYAHKRGVIHRDIKPGNVMVTTEGSVKVVDFGIARLLDASSTQTGMLIGTLGYMAPQQIQGEHADERSDIWAVGVMFYELMCYERPFTGQNHAALMMNIMTEEPRRLSEAVPDCPANVAALVHRMLRKDISERFQSMEEVLLELDPIWRHIQMEQVTEFIAESKEKIETQDFPTARELLRKALQIDTSNAEARTLLEKVNAELRRIKLLPQVKERLEKAQSLLLAGHLQEAKVEAEAALRLDSSFEPARDALRQVLEAVERNRLFQERLRDSQQHLAKGALAEAEQQLEQALELNPASPQAQQLKKEILRERERQEKGTRLREMMHRARGLWKQQKFPQCLALLDALRSEFPSEAEVVKLREAVREDQAEQQKQQKLAEARALLAAKRFEPCLALLDQLQKDFPGEAEAARLRDAVQEEQVEQQKQQKLAEARALLAAKRFEPCLALLETLQREFPSEPDVARLLAAVRKEQAEQRKQQKFAEARSLLAEKRFDECSTLLLELQKGFPDEPEIARWLETVRKTQAEQQKQQKLAEARGLLAEKRFEPCLELLENVDKQFPGEAEIAKLLSTVRKTEAEQQKQQKLAGARSLLAEQRFAESLAVLDGLLELHPNDPAARKLYKIAQQEHEEQKRLARLQQEREALKNLVNEEKYAEAVARGEKLLHEFSGDFEVSRLVEFARARQTQQEQSARLQQILAELQSSLEGGRYEAALQAAQKGLATFPGDAELLRLREQALTKQKEKDKRDLIERRIRDIRAMIIRDELTEAITLARQTLMTAGADTDITQLLRAAEMEHAERERRKAQDRDVDAARTLIEDGDLDEASRVIQRAMETKLFDTYDPRVQEILEEIEEKKKAPAALAPAEASWPPAKPAEPATAYVYQSAASQQSVPIAPADASSAEMPGASAAPAPLARAATASAAPESSARAATPPVVQPVTPPVGQTVPPPAIQPASSPVVPTHQPEAALPAAQVTPATPSAPKEPVAAPRPRVARPSTERPVAIPPAVPAPVWKRPGAIAAAALGLVALVAVLWVGSHFLHHGPEGGPSQPKSTQPGSKVDPTEAQQRDAINNANKLIAANGLEGARDILQKVASLQGPLTPDIQKMQSQVDDAIQNKKLPEQLQREGQLWQQAMEQMGNARFAEAQESFRRILALPEGGRHRVEARQYLDVTIPSREREERLFKQAQQAQQRGDKASLQHASDLLTQVIALNGPRQQEAQQLQTTVRWTLDQLARDEQFANLQGSARQDLRQNDFRSARQKAAQVRQSGGDNSTISSEIGQVEQARFTQLETQFNQLKQRSDDAAVQQLKELQPQFVALEDDAWVKAADARNYADKLIPDAIRDVQTRMANRKAESDYKLAVQHYEQAVSTKDRGALELAQGELQAIVNGNGPHTVDAQKYLSQIPARIAALAPPSTLTVSPPSKTEISPGQSADRDAVLAVVQSYAQAFERRDADALRKIWPTMGNKYDGIKNSFQLASSIQMQVRVENVEIAPGGTTAVVTTTISQVYRPRGEKPRSSRAKTIFRLAKEGSSWFLSAVE